MRTINKLIQIQNELKAPKSQYNSFGKYSYRNVEDILEAVKPLLKEHDCTLTLTDEIVEVGSRVYVKATATIYSLNPITAEYKEGMKVDNDMVYVSAYAREPEDKKGMDASQITGAASSYARKYALNGLFLIDDTKDADYTNTHGQEKAVREQSRASRSVVNITPDEDHVEVNPIVHTIEQGMDERANVHELSKTLGGDYVCDKCDGILVAQYYDDKPWRTKDGSKWKHVCENCKHYEWIDKK